MKQSIRRNFLMNMILRAWSGIRRILLIYTSLSIFASSASHIINFFHAREIVLGKRTMPNVFLAGMTCVMGNQILIPQGKERIVLHSVIAGAAPVVALNSFLILSYVPTGAIAVSIGAFIWIKQLQMEYFWILLSGMLFFSVYFIVLLIAKEPFTVEFYA